MRLAILFHRFGPYHVARLRAASQGPQELVAVELSGASEEYAWEKQATPDLNRQVVCSEGDSNQLPPAELVGRVENLLTEINPDVLAIAGWGDRGMLAAFRWGLNNRKPMLVMSDSQEKDEPRKWHKEWVKRQLLKGFPAGLVAGSPHREYLAQLGIPKDRIFLGYDVVDNAYFQQSVSAAQQNPELRPRLQLPAEYFLACGRFIPKKNFEFLIRAYAAFRKSTDSPCDLVLLGDGPLRDRLMACAQQLSVENHVHFPGFQQYPQLPAYYAFAKAFILPSSHYEQWGLVVNEAMAAGLPVLVSNICGCAPDLVREGENGFQFSPQEVNPLAHQLQRLATDEELRQKMGERSREIIAQWSPAQFSQSLWQAAECAASRPAPGISRIQKFLLKKLIGH
ncbi:glycosyltransferase family 4 protein [Telmatocola sphagniphila]|uniref:Glycosyltransferase family 4 protein n=1 Tax=Telmatocola sphagniphila TaxID=1123043 RepID=A0A8E6EWA0_9BACT|nr:glycosyltransferase family 4 protein [Telmatocola sphagniphila]QVL33775.1 glycosyltransferase family 4 protein [Telmatocola sphagniphila]